MSDTTGTQTPPQVPSGATRCGESRGWQWGTLTLSQESLLVWSERMLKALERGNDRRKWHTLADKVWSPKTLEAALQAVVSNRGAHNRYPNAWFAERGLISLKSIIHRSADSPAT